MNPTELKKIEAAIAMSPEELYELFKNNPQEAERLLTETTAALEKENKQLKQKLQSLAEEKANLDQVARKRGEELRSYLTAAIQDAIGPQWEKLTTSSEEVHQALAAENWPGCADADKLGAFLEAGKSLSQDTRKNISAVIPDCTLAEWVEAENVLNIPVNQSKLDILKLIEKYLKKRDWWWLESVPVRKPASKAEEFGVEPSLEIEQGGFVNDYTGEVESWLKRLTRYWLDQVIDQTKERVRRGSTQLALDSVRIGNERYARAPRLLPPISFAMGVDCKVASGEEFGVAPEITLLIPRGGLIGDRNKSTKQRNHNMLLPLAAEEPESLPLLLAGASKKALSLPASKIATALLIHTAQGEPEKIRTATFGDLCRICYPKRDKIQKSDREAVRDALIQLDKLAIYWPDKKRKDRIFDIQTFYGETTNDTRTNLGLSASFYQGTLTELKEGDELLKMLRGHFVVSLRIMELSKAGQFRQVLRASAMFNDHYNKATKEPRPEAIETYHPAEWARLCNYLPDPDAVHASEQARRVSVSNAIKEMKTDLQELEKEGFLIIKELTKDRILLHPTKDHLEAREKLIALS